MSKLNLKITSCTIQNQNPHNQKGHSPVGWGYSFSFLYFLFHSSFQMQKLSDTKHDNTNVSSNQNNHNKNCFKLLLLKHHTNIFFVAFYRNPTSYKRCYYHILDSDSMRHHSWHKYMHCVIKWDTSQINAIKSCPITLSLCPLKSRYWTHLK